MTTLAPEATLPAEEDRDEEDGPLSHRLGAALGMAIALLLAFAYSIEASEEGVIAKGIFVAVLGFGATLAVFAPHLYPVIPLAYLPFNRAYPLAFVPGLNGSNAVLLMGLGALVVSRLRGRGGRPGLIGFERLLLLYMVLGLVGAMNGALASRWGFLAYTLFFYRNWASPILQFFLVRGLLRERRDVMPLLAVLAMATVLSAACAWRDGIDARGGRSIDDQRVGSVQGQANNMGAFLAYYGAPLLAFAVRSGPLKRRALAVAAFLLCARAIIFTYSRGALLALASGSAAIVGLSHPLGLVAIGGTVLTAQAVPGLLPDSIRARFGHTVKDTEIYDDSMVASLDKSSALRLNLWQGGLEIWQRHPLFGVGLARYSQEIDRYTPLAIQPGDPRDAHNAYILTGAELGLPALATLVALLIWYGCAGLASWWRGRDDTEKTLALVCLGSLGALIPSCMFGSRLADDALIAPFWALMGALFAVRTLPSEEDDDPDGDEE